MITDHCQINSEQKGLTAARESMCKPQRLCLVNNPRIVVQTIVINCKYAIYEIFWRAQLLRYFFYRGVVNQRNTFKHYTCVGNAINYI